MDNLTLTDEREEATERAAQTRIEFVRCWPSELEVGDVLPWPVQGRAEIIRTRTTMRPERWLSMGYIEDGEEKSAGLRFDPAVLELICDVQFPDGTTQTIAFDIRNALARMIVIDGPKLYAANRNPRLVEKRVSYIWRGEGL